MVLIDTDVFIEFFKNDSGTTLELHKIGYKNIAISRISYAELIIGALNSKEAIKLKKVLNKMNVQELNTTISSEFGVLIDNYSKGYGLQIPDALIAATAIFHQIPLFTYNKKHFKHIKELNLYNYEKPRN